MTTMESIIGQLRQLNTPPAKAVIATIHAIQPTWQQNMAHREQGKKMLEDIDGIIEHLKAAQQQIAAMVFRSVPTQALTPINTLETGNEYRFNPYSGYGGIYIEVGNVLVHLSSIGGQVSVGLFGKSEPCLDDPSAQCHLSQADAATVSKGGNTTAG